MSKAGHIDNQRQAFQAIVPGGSFTQISFTAVSQQSVAIPSTCSLVWLFATQDCWIKYGANPTAADSDGTSFLLRGGFYRPFSIVYDGTEKKIAVIRDAVSGELDLHFGA